jgi:serine/threonine protein kinase/tetratricopeptide (TPR) repeat protein
MNDQGDRWREIDALFDAALDLPAPQRAAFLDANCPPELRAKVEALVESSGRIEAETFLRPGAGLEGEIAGSIFDDIERERAAADGVRAGAMVDEYRLVARLGEGGMGEVWEAEQTSPVRRQVALKLLKLGMDSRRVVSRFESERQALALMNHRNVAQVFGGGSTPTGRPYFVMELVPGLSVTAYARQRGLDLPARLALFLDICEGVQHAHHKGIVHRDLKPSNILVTEEEGRPVPKIIDFGVARALDTRLSAGTFVTEQGQIVGTPEYMSPEQADPRSGDIDTRADVYALGVLLYELLAGVRPFDEELKTLGFLELLRRIREIEPPRPSQRADSIQGRRLRGDLDWIVMKALEKDRSRRYVSPHEMAEDVRRHIANQPVLAGPPSRAYRLRKLVRRHRGTMAASALVLVTLVAGAVVATTQAVRARRAERAARAEAETTRQVSDFLVDLFEVSDPRLNRGDTVTARELLDRGAARMDKQLARQPLVHARLQTLMGRTYRNLGLFDPAAALLEQALATRDATLGRNDPETVRTITILARLHLDRRDTAKAEELFRDALQRSAASSRPDRVEEGRLRCQLGNVVSLRGDYAEAERLLRGCRETFVRELGPKHSHVASAGGDLANVLNLGGRTAEAEAAYREAIAIRDAADPQDPRLSATLNNLASLLILDGRPDEARGYVERAVAIDEKVYGPHHPKLAITYGTLGLFHRRQGRLDEAATVFARVLAIREKAFGPANPVTGEALNDVGLVALLRGDHAAARTALDRALAIDRQAPGAHPLQAATTYGHLGLLHLRLGELSAAEASYRQGLAAIESARGPKAKELVRHLRGLADVALRRGQAGEAEAFAARAVDVADQDEASRSELVPALNGLAAVRLAQGRLAEALAVLERAKPLTIAHDALRVETLSSLGDVLAALGRLEDAEASYREAIALVEAIQGGSGLESAAPLHGLGLVLAARGRQAEAVSSLQKALALRRTVLGEAHLDARASARAVAARGAAR